MHKLLTMNDLYSYYANQNKSFKFSAEDKNSQIVVQVNGKLKFDKENDLQGLLPVSLQACHIGENLNGSNIDKEVMEAAMPSFKNRPILGFIHDVDGQPEFYGHNMHLDDDDNIVYDEIPIGIIPESCDAKLEYDEEKDKTYCVVNGYIFEDYTKAAEILKREQECAVSVELLINSLSYDAKSKVMHIEDFTFSGVTILGKDDCGNDVMPGMAKANVKLSDFSQKNNSVFSGADINEKLIESLDKLNETLSNFNKTNVNCQFTKKGGNCMDKLNELLEKYSKTLEDIDFEYGNMSDEELEAKFAEMFEESGSSTEGADGEASKEGSTEDDVEGLVEGAKPEENSTDESNENGSEEEGNYSIEISDGKRTYSVSMNDKIYALNQLVNEVYAEDGTYYSVIAYDDCVVMSDWWSGRNYRQSYKDENDELTLLGDREEVFVNYLTREEEASLEEMKSNYSAIENELNTYKKAELDTKKNEIFAEESYSEYLGEDEFKELIEHKDDYSLEELRDKSEIAFAKCVKKSGTFSKKEPEKKIVRHGLFSNKNTEEKKPYGDLFD